MQYDFYIDATTCPKNPAKKSDRSNSRRQMLITWELEEASEVMPHLMSTATKFTPYWLQKCWIWGKYFLVNSSLSSSIPPNGEEKNIRHVWGSFNLRLDMARHVFVNNLDFEPDYYSRDVSFQYSLVGIIIALIFKGDTSASGNPVLQFKELLKGVTSPNIYTICMPILELRSQWTGLLWHWMVMHVFHWRIPDWKKGHWKVSALA